MKQVQNAEGVTIQARGDISINEVYTIRADQVNSFILIPPKNTCKVEVVPGCFYMCRKTPNLFHRIMTSLLLGWKWTILDEK